jgi:hypothetical protein
MEIDKYMNVTINDFIPSGCEDFKVKFDDLGILKHVNKVSFFSNLKLIKNINLN